MGYCRTTVDIAWINYHLIFDLSHLQITNAISKGEMPDLRLLPADLQVRRTFHEKLDAFQSLYHSKRKSRAKRGFSIAGAPQVEHGQDAADVPVGVRRRRLDHQAGTVVENRVR